MMLQAAAQQPTVPFWLQVSVVALAPVLGFAGVAIGAMLKDRSDRQMALLRDRREVYRNFMHTLVALEKHVIVDGSFAYKSQDEELISKYAVGLINISTSLNNCIADLDLLGSPKVSAIARASFNLSAKAPFFADDDEFDAYGIMRACATLAGKFRDAALRDLGIPRRQRKRMPEEVLGYVGLEDIKAELGISDEQ